MASNKGGYPNTANMFGQIVGPLLLADDFILSKSFPHYTVRHVHLTSLYGSVEQESTLRTEVIMRAVKPLGTLERVAISRILRLL